MWLIIALLGCLSPAPEHDFHVSVAQVHHREGQWQVSLKVFSDDLEKAVGPILDDSTAQADSALARYARQHFALSSGGTQGGRLQYLGHESEVNLTYLYFYFPAPAQPQNVVVKHSFFMELFDDQVNIVNVTVGEELETAYLKEGSPRQKLRFKP